MKNVLICGSGRSGTSMLAGLFSNRGYYQGDDLYEAREANPKGFFENWRINTLNERIILASLEAQYGSEASDICRGIYREGQLWLANLPFDLSCVIKEDDKKELSELVGHRPFCFKDPRFSFTIDAWLEEAADAVSLCVIRHPAAVVRSMMRELQNVAALADLQTSVAQLYENWRITYLRMLRFAGEGREIIFLNYEDLLEAEKLAELEQYLGAQLNREFPDQSLNRSRNVGQVDPVTDHLFAKLWELARLPIGDQTPEKCSAILSDYFGRQTSVDSGTNWWDESCRNRRADLANKVVRLLYQQVNGLKREAGLLRSQYEELFAAKVAKEKEEQRLSMRGASLEEELLLVRSEAEKLAAQLQDLQAVKNRDAEEASRLSAQVLSLEGELSILRSEGHRLTAQYEELLSEKAAMEEEEHQFSVQLASLRGELEAVESEANMLAGRLEELQAAKDREAEEARRLSAEVLRLESELAVSRSEASILSARYEALLSEASAKEEERTLLLKKLEAIQISTSWRVTAPMRSFKLRYQKFIGRASGGGSR